MSAWKRRSGWWASWCWRENPGGWDGAACSVLRCWRSALAVGVNWSGLGGHLPAVILGVAHALAVCAIPLGLILSGATLAEHLFARPADLFEWRTSLAAVVLRLGVMSGLFLLLARFGPFSADLKHVILVQAAMPAAFLPLVLVKHHGGHMLTAVRVVLATVLASILLMPLWLRLGLAWVGNSESRLNSRAAGVHWRHESA